MPEITKYTAIQNHLVVLPHPEDTADRDEREYTYYDNWIENNINQMHCKELTITFKPLLEGLDPAYLKALLKVNIKNIMKNYVPKKGGMGIIGLYELSEVGRYHYHCIVTNWTKDGLAALVKLLRQNVGRTELKQIRFFETYKDYMLKRYTKERDTYTDIHAEWDLIIKQK